MTTIHITGTGSYLPEYVLTNAEIIKSLDTTEEWIVKRTGVQERRRAAPDVYTSDLGLQASLRALDAAGKSPSEVELIIFATITPDTHCPAAANWLQAKLNAPQAVTFDLTAACSGFIFALHTAEMYLRAGFCRNALVVAGEIMTRVVDWSDRGSCILWGDGAGAVVLERDVPGPEIKSTFVHTDGANGANLLMPGGGSKTTPISHESVAQGLHYLKMIEANQSFRVAVNHFAESCQEVMDFNGITINDVDLIVPHQANLRMLQALAKKLDVPMDKVYVTVHKYGNISSATVPIALDEAVRTGAVKAGHRIILTAFGGGLTWGSSLVEWR
ncbi:MAG: ketoacyl-ACP synthase III [Deltaproteobacteria bacterium]|nr:ketoacyl-ACP synthase III [Deltaproteobacteria bacterium]